ncbi:hypothetical protein U9M48_037163 [Paspalum notatum var. saurae]|uniref:DUF6598 domain-containing protein n=1 Tax=Paspalum notatum var. saurae TaxID=547442 RepID=A0AAQ3UKL0_PASNO
METEKQRMETEAGGSGAPARGKKRPPSPDLELDTTTGDADDEWLVSDSGEEDGEEDDENQEFYLHAHVATLTVNNPIGMISHGLPVNMKRRIILCLWIQTLSFEGLHQIDFFLHSNNGGHQFKSGKHLFGSDYNLCDTSERKCPLSFLPFIVTLIAIYYILTVDLYISASVIDFAVSVTSVENCSATCRCSTMFLLQFIDIEIAGYRHTRPGSARIYDKIKPLRNYVYRREIGNCEAVSVKRNTGMARLSLTSPTRVISMVSRALIEFELYVQTEDQSEPRGDCLIEGCTEFTNMDFSRSFVKERRLYGPKCALDVKFAVLLNAIEARIDVKILRLGAIAGSVNLKVLAKTSGFREVIRLFQGAAPEPGAVMSFVVGVELYNYLDLYIEVSPSPTDSLIHGQKEKKPVPRSWWCCGYGSALHSVDEDVAELGTREQPNMSSQISR